MIPTSTIAETVSPLNAFPGPRAFTSAEAGLFYGRDREAAQLTDLLLTYQVVLLYAQSGAGKTSLINARLLDNLGRENCFLTRVRGGNVPAEMPAPGKANIFTFNVLRNIADDPTKIVATVDNKLEGHITIGKDGEMFLIIDQMEEIFSSYPERWEDRKPFFEQLGSLLTQNPNLHLLLAIREEHLASLDFYADLLPTQLRIRYHLQSLRSDQATEAICNPLEKCGLTIDGQLVKKIVDSLRSVSVKTPAGMKEIAGEFVEPLHLQVVGRNLVSGLPKDTKKVTDKQVAAFADVDDALAKFYKNAILVTVNKANKIKLDESKVVRWISKVTNINLENKVVRWISKILRWVADTLRNTTVNENKIRRWFDSQLITAANTRGIVFQGDKKTAGLPNRAVFVLRDESVIREETRAGASWFELTHDRFIKPIQISNNQYFILSRKLRTRLIYGSIALLIYFLTFVAFYWIRQTDSEQTVQNKKLEKKNIDRESSQRELQVLAFSRALHLPDSLDRNTSPTARSAGENAILAVVQHHLREPDDVVSDSLQAAFEFDAPAALAALDEGIAISEQDSIFSAYLTDFKYERNELLGRATKVIEADSKADSKSKFHDVLVEYLCEHNFKIVGSAFQSVADANQGVYVLKSKFHYGLADLVQQNPDGSLPVEIDFFLTCDEARKALIDLERKFKDTQNWDKDLAAAWPRQLSIAPMKSPECASCQTAAQGR